MAKKLRLTMRLLAQSISTVALVLFGVTLLGLRWYAVRPSAAGLSVALGAGVACLFIVGAMIYLHYPSPRHWPHDPSRTNSC